MIFFYNLRKESKWMKIKYVIKFLVFGLVYGRVGGDDESVKDFEILFNFWVFWLVYEKVIFYFLGLYVYIF